MSSRSRRKRAEARTAPEIRSLSLDGGGISSGFTGHFSLPTQAGPSVTEFTSLTVAALFNGVNIYANSIAGLNFHVSKILPKGGTSPARDNPLYDLLSFRPNAEITSFRYRQAGTGHLFTQGNWYSEIERKRGLPVALHLLDPRNVRPVRDESKRLRYHLLREDRFVKPEDMIHVAGLGWDGIRGYSPISLARETLGLAIAEQSYTASLMGNSAAPQGHLEIPGKLPDKTKGTLRDQWNKVHQGSDRAGNIAILDGGLKWVIESFSPADTELILSRKFSIAEIARLLNLPQHMLGLYEGATFSNIEQLTLQFYKSSLMPWLANVQQEFNAKLLTPQDRRIYLIHFDSGDLLRGDTAAQIAYTNAMFSKGALSPNEVRVYFGMNPIDDETADKHFIPVNNLAALEDLDNVLPEPPAKLDPEPAPEQEQKSDKVVESVRRLLVDALGRMVKHECEALRRASKKDRLDLWADEFYPKHRAKVIEAIGPCVEALGYMLRRKFDASWVAARMDKASRDALRELYTCYSPAELPQVIANRCQEWESEGPEAIVTDLIGGSE